MTRGLEVRSRRPQIESLLSRDFTFVLNNWILCSLLFFILVATTFPLISEALTGESVTVGPLFYKAWVQPLGLVLLALMGSGTLFGWKKTSTQALKRASRAPLAALAVAAGLHFLVGRALGFPAVVYSDPIYAGVLGAMLRASTRTRPSSASRCAHSTRGHRAGVRVAAPCARAIRARHTARPLAPRWFARVDAHAVFAVAAVAPPLRRLHRSPRDRRDVRGVRRPVVERRPRGIPGPGRELRSGRVHGSRTSARGWRSTTTSAWSSPTSTSIEHGAYDGRLTPAKFIYKKQPDSPTTEVAIAHGFGDDVYIIVGSINPTDQGRGVPVSHESTRDVGFGSAASCS